jgi:hypothetical protein
VFAGCGDVVGRAGFGVADPLRVAVRAGDHLHVAAVAVVLAGIPQVVAGLGFPARAHGRDERAVQAHEVPAFAQSAGQHFGQVGSVLGDHVDRLVQVPVGGGDADPRIPGQDPVGLKNLGLVCMLGSA